MNALDDATHQTVRVIRQTGKSVLVEYTTYTGLRRITIPAKSVADSRVSRDVLRHGIEYGVPWADLIQFRVTPELVEADLRRRGIWTADDAAANPEAVRGALAAVGGSAAQLIGAAACYEKEHGHG